MCKSKFTTKRLAASLCASAAVALSATLLSVQTAPADCGSTPPNPLAACGVAVSPSIAHIGDIITINSVNTTVPAAGCSASLVECWFDMPNTNGGTFQQVVFTNAFIPFGDCFVCPTNQTGACTGNGLATVGFCIPNISMKYRVSAADLGQPLTATEPAIVDPCDNVTLQSASVNTIGAQSPFVVHFHAFAHGIAFPISDNGSVDCSQSSSDQAVSGTGNNSVLIIIPHLTITKNCVTNCAPRSQPFGQAVQFTGTVINDSTTPNTDITLLGVTNCVVGDGCSAVTSFGTVQPGGGAFTGVLHTGQSVSFSGTENVPGNGCGPVTDNITVYGHDSTGFVVSNSASATCYVCTAPCIHVTKSCPALITNCLPATYQVGGTVSNCGNTTLTSVTVTDTNGCNGPAVITIGTLIPGAVSNWSTTVSVCACGPNTDGAVASGFDQCSGAQVTSVATCTTTNICPAGLTINKLIACGSPGNPASCANPPACDLTTHSQLDFKKTAEGVAGTNNPAFCYQISICNTGCVAVNNVHVSDPTLAAKGINVDIFPSTLQPGQCATNYFGTSWGVGTHVNTATVNGTSSQSGAAVTPASSSATNAVIPLCVTCTSLLLYSADDQFRGGSCSNTVCQPLSNTICLLVTDTNPCPVVRIILTLTNCGQADANVSVTNLPPLVDCGNIVPSGLGPFLIPAGGSISVSNCAVICPPATCTSGPITVSPNLIGTASPTSVFAPCVYDSCGQIITTTSAGACPGEVIACCVTPGSACRVTGGGILVTNTGDTNCGPVYTTIFPNANLIDKITHGGQVGAPFDQMDCGAIIGNLCIRGEWEHNRHYGSNVSDDVITKFHNSTGTPNQLGYFDSLECACLGCCNNGVFIPATSGVFHRKTLCNPDNRICGPEPRPAPANAIIFSGIGVFSPAGKNAKQTYAVWRVYIEDRSEPGGYHPKGSINPADIYCFQAWDTGVAVQQHSDPNNLGNSAQTSTLAGEAINTFRADLGADDCNFLNNMQTGIIPIGSLPGNTVDGHAATINDCGPLYNGNHQIHPSTGATCQ